MKLNIDLWSHFSETGWSQMKRVRSPNWEKNLYSLYSFAQCPGVMSTKKRVKVCATEKKKFKNLKKFKN